VIFDRQPLLVMKQHDKMRSRDQGFPKWRECARAHPWIAEFLQVFDVRSGVLVNGVA